MFSLTVCDHIMIAHSFRGEEFGPAQQLHGATFAVEAEFRALKLDHHQLLIDIGLARTELRRALDTLDYSLLAAACRDGRLGDGGRLVASVKVLLRESPVAWAAYEGPVA